MRLCWQGFNLETGNRRRLWLAIAYVSPTSIVASCALLAASCMPIAAHSATVTYTNVVDNQGNYLSDANQYPTINSAGLLTFGSGLKAGGTGIFTASDMSSLNTIAVSGSNPGWTDVDAYAITNNNGTTVFSGITHVGVQQTQGLYAKSPGGTITPVATVDHFAALSLFNSMDDAGDVAYNASNYDGSNGIYTGVNSSSQTEIVSTKTSNYSNFSAPVMNASGKLVFEARIAPSAGGGSGIFSSTVSGGAIGTVVSTSGTNFADLTLPSLSDNGDVAFEADLLDGTSGIFESTSPLSYTELASTQTGFVSFTGASAINDSGVVAFSGTTAGPDGALGIFVTEKGFASPMTVLSVGQSLFGSTLSYFYMQGPWSMNNNDDIAFQYGLADGRIGEAKLHVSGLANFAVPESSALLLLAFALPLSVVAGKRRPPVGA